MGLALNWIGKEQADRIGQTRMRCYTGGRDAREDYIRRLQADDRPADFLLAERDGIDIGTVTSMQMQIWARGQRIPCQGVAWVGTVKTHRRQRSGETDGIAGQLMRATLDHARARGDVLSALMPFRASFYERFGYGIVEHRNEWTIPLTLLPREQFDGLRFMDYNDLPRVMDLRQRMDAAGQCAIERSPQSWQFHLAEYGQSYGVVDASADGSIAGWLEIQEINQLGRKSLTIVDSAWESPAALKRLLAFLGSLQDQFGSVTLLLPADLPVHLLLRETQLPHRPVEHAHARCVPQTRMQVRILDSAKFLNGQQFDSNLKGRATVAVHHEGQQVERLSVELDGGMVSTAPSSATPDIECDCSTWAAIACGNLSASTAAQLGLINVIQSAAIPPLDALSSGPRPFCREYF